MRVGLKPLEVKLELGSGTIGGRKKKWLFPPLWVPSEIANDVGVESGGRVVSVPEQAATAATASHARRRRCMSESFLIDLIDGPGGGRASGTAAPPHQGGSGTLFEMRPPGNASRTPGRRRLNLRVNPALVNPLSRRKRRPFEPVPRSGDTWAVAPAQQPALERPPAPPPGYFSWDMTFWNSGLLTSGCHHQWTFPPTRKEWSLLSATYRLRRSMASS